MFRFSFLLLFYFNLFIANADERPNIIWMYSDDHAWQAISAYKSRFQDLGLTPNIDRLAKKGMIFNHSYVANSICAPARACVLTGKHSHINGVIDNQLYMDYKTQVTFPQILQKNGYTTAIFGKWHLKSAPQGFDQWAVMPGQGFYHNPIYRVPDGDREKRIKKIGWVDDITAEMSLEFLKSQSKSKKPFMLMCQFKAPHRKWQPPIRHIDTFEDVVFPEPETLFDNYEGRQAARLQAMNITESMTMAEDLHLDLDYTLKRLHNQKLEVAKAKYKKINKNFEDLNLKEGSKEWIRWKYQRYIKEFFRCITAVDENVGKILDYLEESGLDKNTLICYSADQGFYMGEHGWFDKRFYYQESFRTPLLMSWPGKIKEGSVNSDLVQNIDMAPTFLEMAGIKIPREIQGVSIIPLMKGENPTDWRDSLYYHYYQWMGAHAVANHEVVAAKIKGKFYKLANFYDLGKFELMDLDSDPNEIVNQYYNPEYAPIVKILESKLKDLQQKYEVPELPAPNTKWRASLDQTKIRKKEYSLINAKRRKEQPWLKK